MIKVIYASMIFNAGAQVPFEKELFGSDEHGMPWPRNNTDMQHFVSLTKENVLVMGRKTWESMPGKIIKKHNRKIVVISNSAVIDGEGVSFAKDGESSDMVIDHFDDNTPTEILETIQSTYPDMDISIIGGFGLIEHFVTSAYYLVDKIYHTAFVATPTHFVECFNKTDVFAHTYRMNQFIIKNCPNASTRMINNISDENGSVMFMEISLHA